MTQGAPESGGFVSAEQELEELGGGRTDVDDPTAAAEGSQLTSLRDRRAKLLESLYFDLEVPRYDPAIFVRFKPVPARRIDETFARTAKTRDKDRSVLVNAILLADACLGVFEVIAGEPVSVDPDDRTGDWPKFGPELAALLGMEKLKVKSSDVVRRLYLTDGDIIATAQELMERSGYAQSQLERDDSGN